jgi:hypothetical protein
MSYLGDWQDTVQRMSKNMLERDIREAKEMEVYVDDTISSLHKITSDSLLTLFANTLQVGYSNPRMTVQKERLAKAIRKELEIRLDKVII